jgi:peptidoglycan hydrolase-like protein with peptidoglycan-binding domain
VRPAKRLAAGGAVVLAAGTMTAAAIGFGGRQPAPARDDRPPATARITRQTMVDTDEETGTLGYTGAAMLAGEIAGTVTSAPLPGQVVTRGHTIYRVDDRPVVLMYGSVPAYRELRIGVRGHDVRQLKSNLTLLGYGGFSDGDVYTNATAAAVRRWQKALGLARTGRVELGRVLFAPGPVRVASVTAGVGQATGGGREVLRYTGTGRQVTVRLEVSSQRLARRGTTVRVRLPEGNVVGGVVDRAYTVIEDAGSPDAAPRTGIEALVSLRDSRAAAGLEAAVVTVAFTAAEHRDVLVVPVSALVALAEGGYGVEVVDQQNTHYVRAQTGLFANGLVEITGDGLSAGTVVGMPR